MKILVLTTLLGLAALSTGCKDEENARTGSSSGNPSAGSSVPAATLPSAPPKKDEHDHIPIGEKTVGNLKLVATMDAPVTPGGEGAFDLVITGGKPKAVRFWVGAENAEGSVKAKAEEEGPDHWHAHAEIPDPLPPGSRFWAEVEPPTGEKFTVSFDLKTK